MSRKLVAVVALSACLAVPSLAQTSARGVVPIVGAGNFVSSDDVQVCYDMAALGYIGAVTEEMRGIKIDPPVTYSDGNVNTTITSNGKSLAWDSFNGVEVLAYVVKGGPAFHIYNYVGTGFVWDRGLVAPVSKKSAPAISHYNLCYRVPAPVADQGCDHGYWRNHSDRWIGVTGSADFDTTFGVDQFTPDISLSVAIGLNGGSLNALIRHAVAALLNSYGGVPNADGTTVSYQYSTSEVIAMVQAAVAEGGDIEGTAAILQAANSSGCPLSGTSATR